MSSKLRHFEKCPCVGTNSSDILGDNLTAKLKELSIRPPSDGKLVGLFQTLSESIHHCNWVKDSFGAVVVSCEMDIVEKRLLIRFLKAQGYSVRVANPDGNTRLPFTEEVESPEKDIEQKQ